MPARRRASRTKQCRSGIPVILDIFLLQQTVFTSAPYHRSCVALSHDRRHNVLGIRSTTRLRVHPAFQCRRNYPSDNPIRVLHKVYATGSASFGLASTPIPILYATDNGPAGRRSQGAPQNVAYTYGDPTRVVLRPIAVFDLWRTHHWPTGVAFAHRPA